MLLHRQLAGWWLNYSSIFCSLGFRGKVGLHALIQASLELAGLDVLREKGSVLAVKQVL